MEPRGGGAKSGGALRQLRILCPKTAFFGPKPPRNLVKTGKGRQMVRILHLRLNWPVTRSPFLPSTSTICPRNRPKMAKIGLNVRYLFQTGPKPRTGRVLGYLAQNRIPGARIPPATPAIFVVSKPQNRPTRPLDPRTSGHLVELEGSAARARVVPTVGPPGPPGRKKSFFSKLFPDHLGCLKKCF